MKLPANTEPLDIFLLKFSKALCFQKVVQIFYNKIFRFNCFNYFSMSLDKYDFSNFISYYFWIFVFQRYASNPIN